MKHASAATLDRIDGLLGAIRVLGELKEKSRGVFYLKSQAFLHFQEEDGVIYADVRIAGPDFDRVCIKTAADERSLLAKIRRRLSSKKS